MKKLLFVLAMVGLLCIVACNKKESGSSAKPVVPAENQPAPDVQVSNLNGSSLKLSDLKGKVVMLNFWATWCPPCREEIPSFISLSKKMENRPFQLVAVSIDEGGKPAVESFFQTSGFNLPAYTDPDNKAAKTYGITGVPETFIINKSGIIVKKVIGPLTWDSPEIVAFLEELMK